MIFATVLFSLVLGLSATSEVELRPNIPSYTFVSDSLNVEIPSGKSLFVFDLSYNLLSNSEVITYAIDAGENLYFTPDNSSFRLEIEVTPGAHTFAFYWNERHREIHLDSLTIEDQHEQTAQLNFQTADAYQLMKKPVIYLYPEDTTAVEVSVVPKGNFTFTYPDISRGWNYTCTPQGTIHDGEKTYPYLFWEAEFTFDPKVLEPNSGVILSGKKITPFLEAQLTQFGMTSSERADFITYWGPLLQNKTNLYIYFLFDEKCDALASLKINPEPTQISRFYVIWAEVPADYAPDLEPQKVPQMQRDGFTVLEWGGVEIDASHLLIEDL